MRIAPPFVAMLLLLIGLSCHGPETRSDATISIDLTHPGLGFSPTMYGIFFEDINHAGDGGLYAELIQNRDFEYNRVPEDMHWKDDSTIVNPNGWTERYHRPDDLHAWSLIQGGEASARCSLEKANPMNAANPQSLRLEVLSLGEGRAAVANGGYWGIPARKGARYNLSFYARKDSRSSGVLTASLENSSGLKYGSQTINGITDKWSKFQAALLCDNDDPQARFVLAAGSPGTVWLDVVSLFPVETWKDRPNGMREDLAQMLAGLKPSFLAFSGWLCGRGGHTREPHSMEAHDWRHSVTPRTLEPLGLPIHGWARLP